MLDGTLQHAFERHPHSQHHRPIQSMLHSLNAHTYMHVTNEHDSHQVPHPTHAQQTKSKIHQPLLLPT